MLQRLQHLATRLHDILGVSEARFRARGMSFEDMHAFIRRDEVVLTAKNLLEGIHHASMEWHPGMIRTGTFYVRVFLAAYVILLHKDRVFLCTNNETTATLDAANALVEQFEDIMDALISKTAKKKKRVIIAKTRGFVHKLGDYQDKFFAWKWADEPFAISRIKNALFC